MRAMTDPHKRPKQAKTVMNVRSAEGAFVTAIARRRSNQLRSRTSARGTKRTSSDVRLESALRGKADSICSERVFRLLTHVRHSSAWTCEQPCLRKDRVG